MSLTQRVFKSASWNMISSAVRLGFLFIRPIILARELPVSTFGIYAYANSIINLTVVLAGFGMGSALVHRSLETDNENEAASVHFTLKLITTTLWGMIILLVSLILFHGEQLTTMIVLVITAGAIQLTQTPRQLLVRRIDERRLAVLNILNTTFSAIIAIGLAIAGVDLWALLATDIVALLVYVIGLYLINPIWTPRLTWDRNAMKYFISFGSRNVIAVFLLRALDKLDDFWTGSFLGDTPLGFYSRAYTFADYPGQLLGNPLSSVIFGTYAEVQGDRKKLSKAFFRTNSFLIRISFLMGGWLVLIAPEFIRIFLGVKWIPMLDAFRLMLIFTILNPIKTTMGNLFVAVGAPGRLASVRAVQLVVMIIGLFTLGLPFGITGVAVAVDIMLLVGVIILLAQARRYVQFSVLRMFLIPTLAVVLSVLLGRFAIEIPGILGSPWRTAAVKSLVSLPVYMGFLFVFEREEIIFMLNLILKTLTGKDIKNIFIRKISN